MTRTRRILFRVGLAVLILVLGVAALAVLFMRTFYPTPPVASFPPAKDAAEAQLQDLKYLATHFQLDKGDPRASQSAVLDSGYFAVREDDRTDPPRVKIPREAPSDEYLPRARDRREGRRVGTDACVVCALADARALVKTELAGGERVILCATHALIHHREGAKARSVHELRGLIGERRRAPERRESFPCDELGAMLTAGFAAERRTARDRRR